MFWRSDDTFCSTWGVTWDFGSGYFSGLDTGSSFLSETLEEAGLTGELAANSFFFSIKAFAAIAMSGFASASSFFFAPSFWYKEIPDF